MYFSFLYYHCVTLQCWSPFVSFLFKIHYPCVHAYICVHVCACVHMLMLSDCGRYWCEHICQGCISLQYWTEHLSLSSCKRAVLFQWTVAMWTNFSMNCGLCKDISFQFCQYCIQKLAYSEADINSAGNIYTFYESGSTVH